MNLNNDKIQPWPGTYKPVIPGQGRMACGDRWTCTRAAMGPLPLATKSPHTGSLLGKGKTSSVVLCYLLKLSLIPLILLELIWLNSFSPC